MTPSDWSRREFLHGAAVLAGGAALAGPLPPAGAAAQPAVAAALGAKLGAPTPVTLTVNRVAHNLLIEPRVTLLDALREQLGLTGTKKGCDMGACGACTVLLDGRRVNACLTLAAMAQGKEISTIEGLAGEGDELHPLQAAFVERDGLQCGYCTPGQIMAGLACIREGHAGSAAEIREWMSGNLCRCGAYPNIVAAIQDAAAAPGVGGRA